MDPRNLLVAAVFLVGCSRNSIDVEPIPLEDDTGEVSEYDGEIPGLMMRIQAGAFTMGSEEDSPWHRHDEIPHEVVLTRDFLLGAREVTQGAYRTVIGENPSIFGRCDDCPVENVRWHDAALYANAVSDLEGLERCYDCDPVACSAAVDPYSCQGYRLPTEAEWEYAARAGATADFATGSDLAEEMNHCSSPLVLEGGEILGDSAWYCANAADTQPVGELDANAWGLHDTVGNVWEWCHDWYWTYDDEAVDPAGPDEGGTRSLRGGSWESEPEKLRLGNRGAESPRNHSEAIGLRLARTAP